MNKWNYCVAGNCGRCESGVYCSDPAHHITQWSVVVYSLRCTLQDRATFSTYTVSGVPTFYFLMLIVCKISSFVINKAILPRDAMLAWYMLSPRVCSIDRRCSMLRVNTQILDKVATLDTRRVLYDYWLGVSVVGVHGRVDGIRNAVHQRVLSRDSAGFFHQVLRVQQHQMLQTQLHG